MGKMSLQRAKTLSEKKWALIVENDGFNDDKIFKKIPCLKKYFSNCSMCHYQYDVMGKSCDDCIYFGVCGTPYQTWLKDKSKESAQNILNEIIKANNK